jgi:hypothetical protein
MLAEKAADMIRGRDPLPASNAPVWRAPEWQSRQREKLAAGSGNMVLAKGRCSL